MDAETKTALLKWAGWTQRTITHEAIGGTKTYWCDPDRNRDDDSEDGPDLDSLEVLSEMAQRKLSIQQWWRLDEWLEKNGTLPAVKATPVEFRNALIEVIGLKHGH